MPFLFSLLQNLGLSILHSYNATHLRGCGSFFSVQATDMKPHSGFLMLLVVLHVITNMALLRSAPENKITLMYIITISYVILNNPELKFSEPAFTDSVKIGVKYKNFCFDTTNNVTHSGLLCYFSAFCYNHVIPLGLLNTI